MSMSKSTNLASALVGAAGGALALYLLDPAAGKDRRDQLTAAGNDVLDKARQQLESVASIARGHVDRVHHAAADVVGNAAQPLRDAASAHLQDAAGAASNMVDRVVQETQSALNELKRRGNNAASALSGDEPSSHIVPIALSAAGFCAAGVGLMWLMDPDRGRTRRAHLGQQARHILNQTSRTFNGTGRHLRNKLTGYAAVAERNVKEQLASPEPAPVTE